MQDMREGNCPICDHDEVIEAVVRDLLDDSAEYKAVTYEAVNFGTIVPIYQRVPHGVLKMYVCRSCGYTQWFADSPKSIPIGKEFMTKLIVGPDRGEPR
jgi:rubrerythrin